MKGKTLNRTIGAFVISAVSLMGTTGFVFAQQESQDQPQPSQQQGGQKKKLRKIQQQPQVQQPQEQQKDQKALRQTQRDQPQDQQQPKPIQPQDPQNSEQKALRQQQDQKTVRQHQDEQQRNQQPKPRSVKPQRLPQERQRERIDEQKQRSARYQEHLQNQESIARQRSEGLRQDKRLAQYRFQQRYYERMRQQRIRLANTRSYNYGRDPYFYTASNLRYVRDGRYYETNQYGASHLRQAVNYGYQEGFQAGQADRQDRWGNSFEDSYAFQDASYGYNGYYVEQGEYNHYFREGFRRGYEDGYNSRYHYGRQSKGAFVVLASVLAGILVVEALD
jgi:hypothetical protein